MNITVIGTGYVGFVSGICYAELGNHVVCVDKDLPKVETLRNGGIPIYEPGLQELSDKNMAAGRLSYTTDLSQAVEQADLSLLRSGRLLCRTGKRIFLYRPSCRRDRASDERV